MSKNSDAPASFPTEVVGLSEDLLFGLTPTEYCREQAHHLTWALIQIGVPEQTARALLALTVDEIVAV